MTPREKNYENLAKTVIKNLEQRNFEAHYAPNEKAALELTLSLISEGSCIGYGGSMTLSEIGLLDALDNEKYKLLKRDSAKTPEETEAVFKEILFADYFLTSTNALTVSGELVNVDGRGNRVSFLTWGPKNVIVVAGINKITADLDSALARIDTIAAPMNAVRLNRNTPCAITGVCADCQSPDCICASTVITRRSHIKHRIKVIIVGKELGY